MLTPLGCGRRDGAEGNRFVESRHLGFSRKHATAWPPSPGGTSRPSPHEHSLVAEGVWHRPVEEQPPGLVKVRSPNCTSETVGPFNLASAMKNNGMAAAMSY